MKNLRTYPINVLIKPASGNCNMRCRYCFYHALTEKRKDGGKGIMSGATAVEIIKKIFAEGPPAVSIMFQGGEPSLAGLDFFKFFVSTVKKYNVGDIPVSYGFQTNGTLIDGEWCAFFNANKFLVGLSLDGGPETHDFLRAVNGNGKYKDVLACAKHLVDNSVEFNILTVATKYIAKHPKAAYSSYKKLGFRYLQFIACLDDPDMPENYAPDAETYGEFLCSVYRLWKKDYEKGEYISIRLFDNLINKLNGRGGEQCGMSGVCSIQNVIEADGTVYPCDFYCSDTYELGNIHNMTFKELCETARAKEFFNESLLISGECKDCRYYPLCGCGCKRERKDGKNIYCASYKKLFKEMLV